jgi:hypothetical protein
MENFCFNEKVVVDNLLSFNFYYVGATQDDVSVQSTFVDKGIWTCFWDDSNVGDNKNALLYQKRALEIKRGDLLIIKKLNGRAQTDMTITAIGVVVGRKNDSTVYVEWVLPDLNFVYKLKIVGTISEYKVYNKPGGADELYKSSELLDWKLFDLMFKAVCRFIRLNLDVKRRCHLS